MRIDRVKIATELARLEWRDKRLAAEAAISRATVSAIKGGKSVSPITVYKVAHALGMEVDAIIEQEVKPLKQ